METETTIAETVEQTTPAVGESTQPVETQTTEETTTQEPETTETETTVETDEGEKVTDWEKIAKDNQASFTKISQEKAELTKRIEELENQLKPKIVQEGKINPEFEQRYRFNVDNQEFMAYENLSRQLEPEQREQAESLLREAQRLYNPKNNRAYESKMAEVKDYFRSDIVEQIATEKQGLLSQIKGEFDKAIQQDRQQRADKVAEAIEGVPELNELLAPESENYSPEVFGIVKTMFDYTGGVDIEATQKAISKIKELGVKEYLAKQTADKEKAQANVPTGETVVQKQASGLPTADELRNNAGLYSATVKKLAGNNSQKQQEVMKKLDSILMKG
jgi:hypothetical protein